MQETTITMTTADQRRAWVLTKLLCGELSVREVALFLGLSERSVWRLQARFAAEGPAALVHSNRGRASGRRTGEATRARVLALARTTYAGVNDTHLAELLAEREGIALSRVTVRRILRVDGIPSPRHRRAPRHRSRRGRMAQAGLLVQVDGSRHAWLEDRGPRLTLVGGIDDATGILVAAPFRDQEDTAGYLTVLRDAVRRHGVPGAWYRDRHGIFETPESVALTLEEQLADTRTPTQIGRALAELGIGSIAARSPRPRAASRRHHRADGQGRCAALTSGHPRAREMELGTAGREREWLAGLRRTGVMDRAGPTHAQVEEHPVDEDDDGGDDRQRVPESTHGAVLSRSRDGSRPSRCRSRRCGGNRTAAWSRRCASLGNLGTGSPSR